MKKILIDSGPLITLFDGSDEYHVDDFQRIKELIIKYSDLPMDFADACLVFLGEKLNISNVATIDRDFDVYKLKGKKSFTTYIK